MFRSAMFPPPPVEGKDSQGLSIKERVAESMPQRAEETRYGCGQSKPPNKLDIEAHARRGSQAADPSFRAESQRLPMFEIQIPPWTVPVWTVLRQFIRHRSANPMHS